MNLSFIFEMLFMALRGYLRDSKKLAPYAKWAIRIRDYLLLFFPVEIYPVNATADVAIVTLTVDDVKDLAVPIEAVKKEAKKLKFNLPFLKGM